MGGEPKLADRIRDYVMDSVVRPATKTGKLEVAIRAGDIQSQMGLQNRLPAVCAALGANKFEYLSGLQLVRREEPHVGSNSVFYFRRNMTSEGSSLSPRPSASQGPPQPKKLRPARVRLEPSTEIWVSCVSKKGPSPTSARSPYVSDWFTKARRFVESTGSPWRILSAKYGLVLPNKTIDPYEQTLNKMNIGDRRRWADKVLQQLYGEGRIPEHIVMLAGARYREFLEPELRKMGVRVDSPMAGLRIGEQLQWLGEQRGNRLGSQT